MTIEWNLYLGRPVDFHEYRFVISSGTVTMRQIAHEAKVAVSTVSKALRNDPSISESRSREIQNLAKALGYHPNPLVSTLMAQLHHHRRRSDPHNIAWIDLWKGDERSDAVMSAKILLNGASERAAELGYTVESHHPVKDRITPEKLVRRLTVKGEWGIIIPPVPESFRNFPIDLQGLSAVTIGTSLHLPNMHRVSPNHFQGCMLAFEQLQRRGFCRIGLALSASMNERVEGKWLGAFLSAQVSLQKSAKVRPLLCDPFDTHKLAGWIRKERPDAVLVAEEYDWKKASSSASTHGRSLSCPRLGWLMSRELGPGSSGSLGEIDYRAGQLGRVAIEMVVAQIHRNERGEPSIPQTVMIDAHWVDIQDAGS